jgi:hypothetical protein
VLVLVLAALASVRLPALHSHLTAARTGLTSAQQALRDGDITKARTLVAKADREASAAHTTTNGMTWRWVRRLPGLGIPFRELAAVSDVTHVTTSRVAVPLSRVSLTQTRWTGQLDTTPLVKAQRPLREAESALASARRTLAASPTSGIGPLDDARSSLTRSLDKLSGTVREASIAADVLPALAGSDQPRRYFVAIQNPAEQRATGGLIGAYGILRADHGRLTLEKVGADNELNDAAKPVIDLGPEFDRRYGRFGATSGWRSANLTPDVPTAGRILSALWTNATGQKLDGVVFLDPAALGLVLRATGPVTLTDGTRLTAANASALLTRDVYRRFPRKADARRNNYLQEAAKRVFTRLSQPGIDPRKLLAQGGKAVGTGHLHVWTSDPRVEARLRASTAGGALPGTTPYLRVLTQDAGGSKLDYYLKQKVSYDARPTGEAADLGAGPQPEEEGTVRISLTNSAPKTGLPEYVTLRADAPDGKPRPVGQLKSWVSVYLGPRSTLLGATLDGQPVRLSSDTEQGHAVFSTFVSIDPGATRSLVLKVRQPIGPPIRA